MSFEIWMKKVNQALERLAGVSADDIGDIDYHSRYEDGLRPEAAAHEALVESGW